MSQDFFHYLPVNETAIQWGFYLTGAGRACIPPGQSYPPQGHPSLYNFEWRRGRVLPEFQIILITDGQGMFESQQVKEEPLSPGSLLFLFPGVWHRYRPETGTGWTERWISFNGEIIHRLLELNILRPGQPVLPLSNPEMFRQEFDHLLARVHTRASHNSILLSLSAMGLLANALEQGDSNSPQTCKPEQRLSRPMEDPLVGKALEMIWTHSHRELSVLELAQRLPVNRRTLDRRFKAVLGHSVLEEIHGCRLSRCKRLLDETNLPIKTVAYLAGFASAERMRLTFLSREKITPSAYRARKDGSGRPKKSG